MQDGDEVLIIWTICSFLWDILCLGFASNRVFYHGNSGWWFLLAIILSTSGVYKALNKRFQIKEND